MVAINSDGVATAVAAGVATIRAEVDGVLSSPVAVTVTGTPPPTVATVTVSPSMASLEVGDTQQFSAAATTSGGMTVPDVAFIWTSSDAEVATISSTGLATGIKAGEVTITATADGQSGAATLQVTEPPTPPPPLPTPRPDLTVGSPSVTDSSPDTGDSFNLSATVSNDGDGASASTTLRYYRSTDATITTSDTQVGTDELGVLAAAGRNDKSVGLTAPSSAGTYYYGACVDAVTGESVTTNNCSSSVQVTVSEQRGDGDQPVTEVHLFRPFRVEEHESNLPMFVIAWTTGDHAPTESIPVRVWLVAGTADEGVDFVRFTKSVEFNAADFTLDGSQYVASKELTITILDDTEAEGDETFGATMTLERDRPFVTLSPNYPDKLSITILANDAPPSGTRRGAWRRPTRR